MAHSCILSLALLTPFTLSPSVDVFFACRMIQTALMGQYVLLHPRANSKLQALLRGTPMQRIFFCTSWDDLHVALQCFKHPQAVYLRFCHIANFQPKFYVGSTSSFVLDREHSRYRKFLQVQQNKFVLAEVALRFWCRFDNFWMWSVFPIYTNKSNFWALEQALIQLWQPRLNTPFIYQFFNCRKGLISRTKFSNSRQFGAFSLWRKLRWQSTPQHVRRALHSPLFHRRVQLWEIIQDLGSNSIRRFHMEKRLRSNETGAQGCYFIRRLANSLGEPQRSYAINAIDRALTFWKAKRVRKPVPLRAPWLLAPNWTRDLRKLLTTHVHGTNQYTTTLPYRLHPPVLYLQSSHRSWTVYAITKKQLQNGRTVRLQNVPVRPYNNIYAILIVLINTWSLMEIVYSSPIHLLHPLLLAHFRTKSSHHPQKSTHPFVWPCDHGLPGTHSLHYQRHISMHSGNDPFTPTIWPSTTTSPTRTSYASNSSFRMPSFKMKTNEPHPYGSIVRWSIFSASPRPSPIRWYSANWRTTQATSSRRPSPKSPSNLARHTLGPLVLAVTYETPTSCQNAKNSFWLDDQSLASLRHLSDLC